MTGLAVFDIVICSLLHTQQWCCGQQAQLLADIKSISITMLCVMISWSRQWRFYNKHCFVS